MPERGHTDENRGGRSRATHIMVVTDRRDQTGGFNRRIESRLVEMKAGYSRSVPTAVNDDNRNVNDERQREVSISQEV